MRKELLRTADLAVAVCRYAPGERHALHTDRHSRISFLVRGGYCEEASRGALRLVPGDILLKASDAKHEDVFGETGATVVALEFLTEDDLTRKLWGGVWKKRDDRATLQCALAYFDSALAGDCSGVATAGFDILNGADESSSHKKAPRWLRRLEADLREANLANVDLNERAREAGVHPAHLSRLFRQCFGMSVTEHAQTQGVRRAFRWLADGESSLAEIASAAGFYDQSHMNRTFRRITGRTPGAHRAAFATALG